MDVWLVKVRVQVTPIIVYATKAEVVRDISNHAVLCFYGLGHTQLVAAFHSGEWRWAKKIQ